MLRVKKIFNNNAVLIENESAQESVVLGKGVGFGKQAGDEINPDLVEKTFSLTQHQFSAGLVELLNTIPLEYFRIVNLIVNYANTQLNKSLSNNIYISLLDHLSVLRRRAD